ncbi:hypothetical protein C7S13_4322 [Burkholderia cepacia]|nr:hypothetical protein [Burkholderia cepacia]
MVIAIPSSVKALFADSGWRGDSGCRVSSGDGEHPGMPSCANSAG